MSQDRVRRLGIPRPALVLDATESGDTRELLGEPTAPEHINAYMDAGKKSRT